LNFAEDTESCDALVALGRKNDDDEFFAEKFAEIDALGIGGLNGDVHHRPRGLHLRVSGNRKYQQGECAE
jgi:hypothetical protein